MNERTREWWVVRIVVVGATGGGGRGCRGDGREGHGGRGGGGARARPRAGGAWERWRACWAGRGAGPRQPHNSAVLPSFSGDNDDQWRFLLAFLPFLFRLGLVIPASAAINREMERKMPAHLNSEKAQAL